MPAYYGLRISDHMTRTPEGFLICHDVPIARTGWQDYLAREIPLPGDPDRVVKVYRDPNEVFKPSAMSSFTLKSVADDHPGDEVRPDNYSSYERGQVSNVHRGTGSDMDLLIADLIIKDPVLIAEIENGTKRDVSCGYDCDYETQPDGTYRQTNIRGNHVAIVARGRAGDRVSIKDGAPEMEHSGASVLTSPSGREARGVKERRTAVKVDRTTIWGKMLSAFAKDAEPEELAEAARMAPPDTEDELMPSPIAKMPQTDEPAAPAGDPAVAELAKAVLALGAKLDALLADEKEEAGSAAPEGLDALESELSAGEGRMCPHCGKPLPASDPTGEASVTIPAERMGDDLPDVAPEDRPRDPFATVDSRAILRQSVKDARAILDVITDPASRKRVEDAMTRQLRDRMGAAGRGGDGYETIQRTLQSNARDGHTPAGAVDADPQALGRQIAESRNPHYQKHSGEREVK
jgi:hypothetical protein